MNVGQIYECLLGFATQTLQQRYRVRSFDEIHGTQTSRSFLYSQLYKAREISGFSWLFQPSLGGKMPVFDGRTGKLFESPLTVGYSYILRLIHMVDEKFHARSSGPYNRITQQPLQGRSHHGGQRVGEMEVWALEGFGVSYFLQELFTYKADDIVARKNVVTGIIYGQRISEPTVPESFRVVLYELRSLCFDITYFRST
jgi:DNA-directed RNA polymerase subunit beta